MVTLNELSDSLVQSIIEWNKSKFPSDCFDKKYVLDLINGINSDIDSKYYILDEVYTLVDYYHIFKDLKADIDTANNITFYSKALFDSTIKSLYKDTDEKLIEGYTYDIPTVNYKLSLFDNIETTDGYTIAQLSANMADIISIIDELYKYKYYSKSQLDTICDNMNNSISGTLNSYTKSEFDDLLSTVDTQIDTAVDSVTYSKPTMDTALNGLILQTDIVNNLTTDDSTKPISSEALKSLLTRASTNKQEVVVNKTSLADALTFQGIPTSASDSFSTIKENIGKLSRKTSISGYNLYPTEFKSVLTVSAELYNVCESDSHYIYLISATKLSKIDIFTSNVEWEKELGTETLKSCFFFDGNVVCVSYDTSSSYNIYIVSSDGEIIYSNNVTWILGSNFPVRMYEGFYDNSFLLYVYSGNYVTYYEYIVSGTNVIIKQRFSDITTSYYIATLDRINKCFSIYANKAYYNGYYYSTGLDENNIDEFKFVTVDKYTSGSYNNGRSYTKGTYNSIVCDANENPANYTNGYASISNPSNNQYYRMSYNATGVTGGYKANTNILINDLIFTYYYENNLFRVCISDNMSKVLYNVSVTVNSTDDNYIIPVYPIFYDGCIYIVFKVRHYINSKYYYSVDYIKLSSSGELNTEFTLEI